MVKKRGTFNVNYTIKVNLCQNLIYFGNIILFWTNKYFGLRELINFLKYKLDYL